jgi:energy-converting hydrogenase Eha subunit G
MRKEIILSNLGFLIGAVGVIIAVIPFFNLNNPKIYNIILPIILGIAGLILVFKIKKELNDDIVKVGLVVNPLAIILAIIQFVIYLTK